MASWTLNEYEFGVEMFLSFASKRSRDHFYSNGIDESYTYWIFHGKSRYTNKIEDWRTYKSNEFDEAIGIVQTTDDCCVGDTIQLDPLFEDATKPLYNGCSKFMKLSSLVKLLSLKTRHGFSN